MPKLAAIGGHPPPAVGPGLPPLATQTGYPMSQGPSGPPPPPPGPSAVDPNSQSPARPVPAFLDELDPNVMPPELKKEGPEYWAVFNPKTKRVIDIDIVHTFPHPRHVIQLYDTAQWLTQYCSVVCCVQFSADGKYLATGCNRKAQIFDVKTGHKTAYVHRFPFDAYL